MNANSTLYWSSLYAYEHCGQGFLWSKGWNMEDVGGGPGMKKPVPIKESRHHAVMGLVLAAAWEKLYNDELWRDPKNLSKNLLKFLDQEWFRQTRKNYINWDRAGMTADEMLDVCREGVVGYLQTMKRHRLLSGTYARSEVDLVGWIDKWNPVGGRADLIIKREDTGLTILDGKNSKRKVDVDVDQLRWYGLLYLLSYKEMPDRLGFVWYRYPYGKPVHDASGEPEYGEDGEQLIEEGVDWVDFTKDDFRGLADRAVEAKKGMRKGVFDANPVPSYCKYCVYETVCPQRQAQKGKNSEKRNQNRHIDEISKGGFTDFSV